MDTLQLFLIMVLFNTYESYTANTPPPTPNDVTAPTKHSPKPTTTHHTDVSCCAPCPLAHPHCTCNRTCSFQKMGEGLSFLHTPLTLICCGVGIIGNIAVLIVAFKH